MASTFTALPLTSGESFLLETQHAGKNWVVLVDSGQSKQIGPTKNGLYTAIQSSCPNVVNRIDVAICTHSDHDHAGGYPAFLETWLGEGKAIGEFWLPYGWSAAVRDALINPANLSAMIVSGARESAVKISHEISRRYAGARKSSEGQLRAGEEVLITISSQLDELRRSAAIDPGGDDDLALRREAVDIPTEEKWSAELDASQSWGFTHAEWDVLQSSIDSERLTDVDAFTAAPLSWAYDLWVSERGRAFLPAEFMEQVEAHHVLSAMLIQTTMQTAATIRAIASAAVMHNIPVRWFDFGVFERTGEVGGGIPSFLIPLNSMERAQVEKTDSALRLVLNLHLTEQNVASLVFQRVETDNEPSAIFLADSRLAFGVNKPTKNFPSHLRPATAPPVFTAPHHGSQKNDRAYEVLKEWLGDCFDTAICLRNGGVWNQTLTEFLSVGNRRCAQCYQCHGSAWQQLAQITSSGKQWVFSNATGQVCKK